MFSQTIIYSQVDSVLSQIQKSKSVSIDKKLKIIHIKNFNDSNIYCKLFFDVPPHLSADSKGIDFITGKLLSKGVAGTMPDEFAEERKKEGMTFDGGVNYLSVTSTDNNVDEMIKYLSSLIFYPEFDEKEFEKILKAKIKTSFPPGISPRMYVKSKAAKMLYGDEHPYGENYSKEKLPKLTSDECRRYLHDYLLTSDKYLVVIGNVSLASIISSAKKYFERLSPAKPLNVKLPDVKLPKHTMLNFHETEEKITGKRTYLSLLYPANLKINDNDYYKVLILNKIFGAYQTGRLYKKLITEKKIADFVFSELKPLEIIGEFETTVVFAPSDLAKIVNIIIDQQAELINNPVYEGELQIAMNLLNKDFIKKIENNHKVSEILFNIEKYNIPPDYYTSFIDKIKLLKPKDIQKTAKKYLRTDRNTIVVLGESKKARNEFLKLAVKAEINVYENDTVTANISYGFGAINIIEEFLKKVKADKVPANQTINIKAVYDFGNQTKTVTQKILRKKGNYKSVIMLRDDSTSSFWVKQEIFNKKNTALITAKEIHVQDSNELSIVKTNSYQFPELEYSDNNLIKVELLGIYDINEVQVYKILVSYPNEKYRYDYYDTKTYLKIMSETLEKEGDDFEIIKTIEISDYKEIPDSKGKMTAYSKKITSDNFEAYFKVISVDLKTKINKKEFIIPKK